MINYIIISPFEAPNGSVKLTGNSGSNDILDIVMVLFVIAILTILLEPSCIVKKNLKSITRPCY